ncbi:MAG: phosphopantetheine adenylyltransferase, partial [Aquabacterium sp.]
ANQGPVMHVIVPAVLLLVALIHAPPVIGVLGGGRLARLYGIDVQDPAVVLLLRHRAVLFGLLAAGLSFAAFQPQLHGLALVAGLVSVASFLWLAPPARSLSQGLAGVVRADWLALALLVLGVAAHLLRST